MRKAAIKKEYHHPRHHEAFAVVIQKMRITLTIA
jgi:hypothetical protein